MVEHWIAIILAPLAYWVLFNGVDDLFVAVVALLSHAQRLCSADPQRRKPSDEDLDTAPSRRTAVFVALWQEHRVIQKMIDNNISRIRYPGCDFFVGVYPNDAPTIAAVREAMARYPNVHLSICPHDGPTSKADNLNWIYQRMLLHEEKNGVRFETILTHDAEDLMDADALRWINYYAQWNDMVQIPVLALPTPFREVSHGVYCDEFAEFQFKDMEARQFLGGFIPSSGVGTGYSRRALEMLADSNSNRIFEPGSLTEDYENGFKIRRLGLRQKFIPVHFHQGRPVATREYFPRRFGTAVRQRTRWVMGITLQSWEYRSARDTLGQLYWFWRDRKGLAGNLITPLINIVFVYGAATWAWAYATHCNWPLARELARFYPIYAVGLTMQAIQTTIRAVCSGKVYGWRFACGVPLRVLAANVISAIATARAIGIFANAKVHGRPLVWVKTEHAYPNRAALRTELRPLSEILVGGHWITMEQLTAARASMPAGHRIGEYLISLGLIGEADLYTALSLQNDLPLGKPDEGAVSIAITRALPAEVSRKWRVLPFRIAAGELYVAGAELPGAELQQDIRRFSSLEIRFQLVTPSEFAELATHYL